VLQGCKLVSVICLELVHRWNRAVKYFIIVFVITICFSVLHIILSEEMYALNVIPLGKNQKAEKGVLKSACSQLWVSEFVIPMRTWYEGKHHISSHKLCLHINEQNWPLRNLCHLFSHPGFYAVLHVDCAHTCKRDLCFALFCRHVLSFSMNILFYVLWLLLYSFFF
jgi:hypothetical protein